MLKQKKILAIETSNELCSVALLLDKNIYDERNIQIKHVHSERLIPVIDELLRSNKTSAKELWAIAVSIGPGSFTGLRIGLTAAKGIAFAAEIPIIPVPTFSALALEISEYFIKATNFIIANNANIEECYLAKFKFENGSLIELQIPELISKKDVDKFIDNGNLVFGNLKNVKNIKNISAPRASSVAKWTYLFGEDLLTFDYDYLEPNYLKDFKVKKAK
ncbi:MAG: tRNA (adenosine(37)-N6)-threonylcarbamoyltransferase complex dimerization subunit type 1 TsaB [Ignavibacteriae bacterium]|nr:tRNA (adenosine(37)-N6)-threonylcarbamoyltransferase complex dimerization subunit type 1 TsaB [Ignavibacteriota bacterium]